MANSGDKVWTYLGVTLQPQVPLASISKGNGKWVKNLISNVSSLHLI